MKKKKSVASIKHLTLVRETVLGLDDKPTIDVPSQPFSVCTDCALCRPEN